MRLFQFIKWWWNKTDSLVRGVMCFLVLWFFPWLIASIWIGPVSILAILVSVLAIMIGGAFLTLSRGLREEWKKFGYEVPPDDVRIIRRLKGEVD